MAFAVVSSRRYRDAVARVATALRLHPGRTAAATPWDHAFSRLGEGWVRVRFADGRWLGGWYGAHSSASSRSFGRVLFVEEAWVVDVDGRFTGRMHAPGGMVIHCSDAIAVDFLPSRRDTRPGARDEREDST